METETHIEVGQVWRHKKKLSQYRVTAIKGTEVHLTALTKGSRSTWKYDRMLPWDYELLAEEELKRLLAKEVDGKPA